MAGVTEISFILQSLVTLGLIIWVAMLDRELGKYKEQTEYTISCLKDKLRFVPTVEDVKNAVYLNDLYPVSTDETIHFEVDRKNIQ
jgi:hypothetical protein